MPRPSFLHETGEAIARRVAVALGKAPADLMLSGAQVLLPTGEFAGRDVVVCGPRIAAVAERWDHPVKERIDLTGKVLVPGYVEPHTHALGPLSLESYTAFSLRKGVTATVTDDSYAYTFLNRDQYTRMLDFSRALPVYVEWSMRTEPHPRTISLRDLADFVRRPDAPQVGEVIARPQLENFQPELASLFAATRARGGRIEGHSPGASAASLGAATAAGITADHEAITPQEAIDRQRLGVWAILRHNSLRPDVTGIVEGLLESGLPIDRVAFTIDGATPGWMKRNGTIDATVKAALEGGLDPARAIQMATLQPASYIRLDDQLGLVAPGRRADLNVLPSPDEPTPETVYLGGIRAVDAGELLIEFPKLPWREIGASAWSPHSRGPDLDAYRARPDDPAIRLESQAIVRFGEGEGEPITSFVIDPVADSWCRARIFGFPPELKAAATTLSPERRLVAVGSDAEALKMLVDEIYAVGGGFGYHDGNEMRLLPLPFGGTITDEPFDTVADFWIGFEDHLQRLGHRLPDPTMTLLFIPTDSLPGARFVTEGLIDTRSRKVVRAATPIAR